MLRRAADKRREYDGQDEWIGAKGERWMDVMTLMEGYVTLITRIWSRLSSQSFVRLTTRYDGNQIPISTNSAAVAWTLPRHPYTTPP